MKKLLFLLLLVSLLFAGCVKNDVTENSEINKNEEIDKKEQEPLVVQKPNWKVYESKDKGFKVNYPEDWPEPILKEGKFYAGGAYPAKKAPWRLYLGEKRDLDCYNTSQNYPYYFEEYNDINLEEVREILLANDLERSLTISYKKEDVNGVEVIWYHEGGEAGGCNGHGDSLTAIIFDKEKDRIIRFATEIEIFPDEIFDKILYSFELL